VRKRKRERRRDAKHIFVLLALYIKFYPKKIPLL